MVVSLSCVSLESASQRVWVVLVLLHIYSWRCGNGITCSNFCACMFVPSLNAQQPFQCGSGIVYGIVLHRQNYVWCVACCWHNIIRKRCIIRIDVIIVSAHVRSSVFTSKFSLCITTPKFSHTPPPHSRPSLSLILMHSSPHSNCPT